MKILWFANTPSNAAQEFGYSHKGGGWISSLEEELLSNFSIELTICFFYDGIKIKELENNGVTYIGIPKENNFIEKVFNKIFINLNDTPKRDVIKFIIEKSNPDVIQVFGTENGFGQVVLEFSNKVIFHLQGLTGPYSKLYFSPSLSYFSVLFNSNILDLLKASSFIHKYYYLVKRGRREKELIKKANYFCGRTDWDLGYVKLLNTNSVYFHCDELLRKPFYVNKWSCHDKDNSIISSTINPNMYKGLDLIYRVLQILPDLKIEWRIIGIRETDPLNIVIKKVLKIKSEHRLKFIGQVETEKVVENLLESNAFIHPSLIDNSPNSVCEAMMLGMPVIASSVGGTKSIIKNDENGILFNPYDIYELAGIISNISTNKEKFNMIGQKARITALNRHDTVKNVNKLMDIYSEIVKC
jgi:glycosyltransferase involved in cell wall biosynthesis